MFEVYYKEVTPWAAYYPSSSLSNSCVESLFPSTFFPVIQIYFATYGGTTWTMRLSRIPLVLLGLLEQTSGVPRFPAKKRFPQSNLSRLDPLLMTVESLWYVVESVKSRCLLVMVILLCLMIEVHSFAASTPMFIMFDGWPFGSVIQFIRDPQCQSVYIHVYDCILVNVGIAMS